MIIKFSEKFSFASASGSLEKCRHSRRLYILAWVACGHLKLRCSASSAPTLAGLSPVLAHCRHDSGIQKEVAYYLSLWWE